MQTTLLNKTSISSEWKKSDLNPKRRKMLYINKHWFIFSGEKKKQQFKSFVVINNHIRLHEILGVYVFKNKWTLLAKFFFDLKV